MTAQLSVDWFFSFCLESVLLMFETFERIGSLPLCTFFLMDALCRHDAFRQNFGGGHFGPVQLGSLPVLEFVHETAIEDIRPEGLLFLQELTDVTGELLLVRALPRHLIDFFGAVNIVFGFSLEPALEHLVLLCLGVFFLLLAGTVQGGVFSVGLFLHNRMAVAESQAYFVHGLEYGGQLLLLDPQDCLLAIVGLWV